MKKGLKIWSKLLIASFFLGATVTSAVAQNGATTANCGASLITVTRTANEVNAGTEITLNFSGTTETPIVAGDSYYFVAATGGSLLTVGCDNTIGANLQVVQVNGTDNAITGAESPIVAAGTFTDGNGDETMDPITVKVKSVTTLADIATTLKLGVFVKDEATGCYSDVNWVTIQVLGNIYASLTLNNGYPYEYICSGATTNTNIGFTLCNLPDVATDIAAGTLNYTVTATPTANITGQRVYQSGNTAADLDANGSPWNATITGIDAAESSTIGGLAYSSTYTVEIGNQTLVNANPAAAESIIYSFSNMTYTYNVLDEHGNVARTVTLPVVFESANGACHLDSRNYETSFTVNVAPSFGVSTLAHSTSERNDATPDFEFCQGTIAYLLSTTTATQGAITNWTWSVTGTSANSTEAGAKIGDGTTTPLLAYAATADDDRVENRVQVGQLTDITAEVYKYTLVGKWDLDNTPNNFFDTINEGVGCTATSEISIVVTPAPILLLATDQAEVDGMPTWNVTDQITAPVVCPGQPILIGTADMLFAEDNVDARNTYMNAGNYIKANGAALSYTIDPLGNDNLKAYTDWRSTAAVNGNLPLTQTDPATGNALDPVQYGHFLNNQTNAQASITYTVQNADPNGCALVKKDGSALNLDQTNEGQVKIIFPVQPRPQFQLGAN